MASRSLSALAVLGLTAMATVPCQSASVSLSKEDVNYLFDLKTKALALDEDIIASAKYLNQMYPSDARPDQIDCLDELDHVLNSVGDQLEFINDLVDLSIEMSSNDDKLLVSEAVGSNLSHALRQLSVDRKETILQSSACSHSALVVNYSQETMSIINNSTNTFGDLQRRVSYLKSPAPAAPIAPPAPAPSMQTVLTAPGTQVAPAHTRAPSQNSYSSTPAPMTGEFAPDQEARAHCPTDTVVWVNAISHVYHFPGVSLHGHSYYGNTKEGAYMCEADARAAGNRAAKDERHL
jgi:hypothetical protein